MPTDRAHLEFLRFCQYPCGMCSCANVFVLHASHMTADQCSYVKTVTTTTKVTVHLYQITLRLTIEGACLCLAHWKHVIFVIDLSVAALQSESSHIQNILSLVGFYKREVAENHLHTQAFMYRKTSLTIACHVSIDSKRNLSWKGFCKKCLKFS